MPLYDKLLNSPAVRTAALARPAIEDYEWHARGEGSEFQGHLIHDASPRTLCGQLLRPGQAWKKGEPASRCQVCESRFDIVRNTGWDRKRRRRRTK